MENFNGDWEGCAVDGPELDDFLSANGMTSHKSLYTQKSVYSIVIDGENVTSIMTRDGAEPNTQKAQIGKRCETMIPGIGKGFVTITNEGKYLISKQEIGGAVFINKGHVEGDELILETSGNGKAIITHLKKV